MLEVGKLYWVRMYRDDAPWEPAKRVESDKCNTLDYCWKLIGNEVEGWETEVNEVGPEILPPA